MDVVFDILTHPRALIFYGILGVVIFYGIAVEVFKELRRDQKKLRLIRIFSYIVVFSFIPGAIVAGWILISKFGLIIGIPVSILSVLGVLGFYTVIVHLFGVNKIDERLDEVQHDQKSQDSHERADSFNTERSQKDVEVKRPDSIAQLFKAEGGSRGARQNVERYLRVKEGSFKEFYKPNPSLDQVFLPSSSRTETTLTLSLEMIRLNLIGPVTDSDIEEISDALTKVTQNGVLPIEYLLDLLGDERKVKQIYNPSSAQLALLSPSHRKMYQEMDEWWRMWTTMAIDSYLGEPVIASLLHVFYNPGSDPVLRKMAACQALSLLNYWLPETKKKIREHGIIDIMNTIDAIDVVPEQTVKNLECWESSVRLLSEVTLEQEQLSEIQSLANLKTMFRIYAGANLANVRFVSRLSEDLDSASEINPMIIQHILTNTRVTLIGDAFGDSSGQSSQNATASLNNAGIREGILETFLDDTRAMNTYDKGLRFEEFCQRLLEKMGFIVDRQGGSGDRGVDLIADDPGPLGGKTVIQCKHYDGGTVAVAVVAQTLGLMNPSNANKALVITTGKFTRDAIKFADENPLVDLWDREKVAEQVSRYLES